MKLLILILLVMLTASSIYADTWTVFEMDPSWTPSDEYCPRDLTFSFTDGRLSLNSRATSIGGGGSSTHVWELVFSGNWAAVGTIDESGNLVRDPYATFVQEGYGGYIDWASDTPYGYTAPLLLGCLFNKDGAMTYRNFADGKPVGDPITGTLVLWDHLALRPLEYDTYIRQSHEFSATFVPEPSSMATLSLAVSGLCTALIRKKRRTHVRGRISLT